jgi:hypothetical protein
VTGRPALPGLDARAEINSTRFMPRISVFLPTHEHASTLPYAVRSVQMQGVEDLEILICGDGVTGEVRGAVEELRRADPRIRFFDLPKAPHRGELNRDHVLRQAKGEIICHQNDDDLWLPGHIDVLEKALEDADFVGAMQVDVDVDGTVKAYFFDLERPEFVDPWLQWKPNELGSWACDGFGPIFAAHRRDAFLRLPEGWTTTAPGLPADQSLWHKFLRQPWCRAKFLRWPIALHFPAADRASWSPDQRAEELKRWTGTIESPDYAVQIWRKLLPDLGDRLLHQSVAATEHARTLQAAADAARDALAHERTLRIEAEAARDALAHERTLRIEAEAARDALAHERTLRIEAEAARDAILASTSWRLTAPLRRSINWMRRLAQSGQSRSHKE